MRQKIFTLAISLLFVLALNAQNRGINHNATKANAYSFGIDQLVQKNKPVKNYVYTGGNTHQSKYAGKADLFVDDFEGGSLDNFTVINGGDANGFVWNAEGGNFGPACVSISYDSSVEHDDWLITPQIAPANGTKLTFYARNQSASTFAEDFDIMVSTTGNAAADFTDMIEADVFPGIEWTYYEYDLTAYAGQDIYIGFHSTTLNMWRLFFDDFKIFTPEPNDLKVEAIPIPYTVNSAEQFTPKVIVKNAGTAQQSAYDVYYSVTDTATNMVVLEETVNITDPIAVNATAEVSFTPTTFAPGAYSITAAVVLTGDQNSANDTLVNEYIVNAADLTGMAYAYLLYGGTNGEAKGVFVFNPEVPAEAYRISKSDKDIFAGDAVNGEWYAVDNAPDKKLVKIDFVTGAMTEVADIADTITTISMTYDYNSDKMFICYIVPSGTDANTKLGTLDLTNGETTEIKDLGVGNDLLAYYGLACNSEGVLYGIGSDQNIYTIDNTSGDNTLLAAAGINIQYIQTAAFSHEAQKLYWLSLNADTHDNYEINTTDGSLTNLGARSLNEFSSMVYNFIPVKYNVTFNVTDGTNPIDGAEITIGNNIYTTDAAGSVVVEMLNNTYEYTVRKPGFENASGNFTVADADLTVDVSMNAGNAMWPVNFMVTNDLGAVEGATITIDGATLTTDANGMASTEHVNATDLAYTVEAALHNTYNGTVTIADAAVDVAVMLERSNHTLSFTVKKNWGSNDAIENASITITSGDSTYTAATDASGMASFANILEGEYTYNVSAEACVPAEGTVNLTADEALEIMLDEAITAPAAVTANVNGLQATITWDMGQAGFSDSFEDDTFNAWSEVIQGAGTPGEGGNAYWHIAEPDGGAAAPDGSKCAKVSWGYNIDTWLITPNISITNGMSLKFNWNKSYYWSVDPNNNDDLMVKISTDNGATWTQLWSEQDHGVFQNFVWIETTLDLSAYAGQACKIAFHVLGDDNASNSLDLVEIGTTKRAIGSRVISDAADIAVDAKNDGAYKYTFIDGVKNQKAFVNYKVYIDDMTTPVATTTDKTYTTGDLSVGTHTAGIQKVFETGESDIVEVEFEITSDYQVTFIVKEGTNALENVNIAINNQNLTTDASGMAVIDLEDGDYDWTATLANYNDASGTVTVNGAAQTVDIIMEPAATGVTLTFNVDMTTPIDSGEFTVGTDKVYVSGNFGGYNWPEPGTETALELMDTDGDKIYTLAVANVVPGTYEYKYFKNNGWDNGEWDGTNNRSVEVADADLTLNDVWGLNPDGVNKLDAEVMISPNPTNGKFTVNVNGTYNLQVVDITGKVVEQIQMNNTATIDLSARNAGMYFVIISNGSASETFKVIKQ